MAIQEKEFTAIPIVEEEYDAFEQKAAQMRSGELEELAFTAFRLREGVYGQRQAGVQMIRIKVPGGIITARQLEAVGELTRNWAPLKKSHITTRECIQVHHLLLEDAAKAKRLLGRVGCQGCHGEPRALRQSVLHTLPGSAAIEATIRTLGHRA